MDSPSSSISVVSGHVTLQVCVKLPWTWVFNIMPLFWLLNIDIMERRSHLEIGQPSILHGSTPPKHLQIQLPSSTGTTPHNWRSQQHNGSSSVEAILAPSSHGSSISIQTMRWQPGLHLASLTQSRNSQILIWTSI